MGRDVRFFPFFPAMGEWVYGRERHFRLWGLGGLAVTGKGYQQNSTGGNPFSGIKKANHVNAARHKVIIMSVILPRKETLCLGRNRRMLSTNDTAQIATSRMKLTQSMVRFPLPRVPRMKKAAAKMP